MGNLIRKLNNKSKKVHGTFTETTYALLIERLNVTHLRYIEHRLFFLIASSHHQLLHPHCFFFLLFSLFFGCKPPYFFCCRSTNLAILWVFNVITIPLFCTAMEVFRHLFVQFRCRCIRFVDCMQNQIKLVAPNGPSNPNMVQQNVEANACKSCNKLLSSIGERVAGGARDVEMVMKKLGLWNYGEETIEECDGKCKDCRLTDEAYILLEEKVANLEELEEAFAVFDENGDGLISAEELRSVMQKLGFKEGKELEDCKKMLRAYDEDGDGKINFKEFRKMLELAV